MLDAQEHIRLIQRHWNLPKKCLCGSWIWHSFMQQSCKNSMQTNEHIMHDYMNNKCHKSILPFGIPCMFVNKRRHALTLWCVVGCRWWNYYLNFCVFAMDLFRFVMLCFRHHFFNNMILLVANIQASEHCIVLWQPKCHAKNLSTVALLLSIRKSNSALRMKTKTVERDIRFQHLTHFWSK